MESATASQDSLCSGLTDTNLHKEWRALLPAWLILSSRCIRFLQDSLGFAAKHSTMFPHTWLAFITVVAKSLTQLPRAKCPQSSLRKQRHEVAFSPPHSPQLVRTSFHHNLDRGHGNWQCKHERSLGDVRCRGCRVSDPSCSNYYNYLFYLLIETLNSQIARFSHCSASCRWSTHGSQGSVRSPCISVCPSVL